MLRLNRTGPRFARAVTNETGDTMTRALSTLFLSVLLGLLPLALGPPWGFLLVVWLLFVLGSGPPVLFRCLWRSPALGSALSLAALSLFGSLLAALCRCPLCAL